MEQGRLRFLSRFITSILVVTLGITACQPAQAPSNTEIPDNATSQISFVDSLLQKMTLDEKIGQMTQVVNNSLKPGDVEKYFIGSVFSGGGGYPTPNTVESWASMTDGFQKEALNTRLGIPLLYGVDAIHGHAALFGATVFPQQIGLGATRDAELIRQIGQATAEELLASGVTWNFAPVVAVPQDIRWGRTYESYSENTELVSELGSAYLEGLQTIPPSALAAKSQEIFVLGTPKHFLGDGGTEFGSSTQNIIKPFLLDQGNMVLDEAAIRELFLPAYEVTIASGAKSIMVSFSSWNGLKMHAQKYWITDVLKNELGFEGFVVSDYAGVDQINPDYYHAVVTAVNAGIDMVMVPTDYIRFISDMKKAVRSGEISEARIDDAVHRILTVKVELGLFDHPYSYSSLAGVVGSDDHRALARQAVRESLVLLKNENDALPLSKGTPTIFVAGKGANDIGMQCGGWTIEWQGQTGKIQPGITILEGIQSVLSSESRVEYSSSGEFAGLADVGIAVVGEEPYAEGVGDSSDLSLSPADIQILTNLREHSKQMVVIILSGRPLVITPQLQLADAWVAAWLPGSEGAGVADVLFGDFPFVGKLPFTWPRSNDQLPLNTKTIEQQNGSTAPLFPYGYGLGTAEGDASECLECKIGYD